MWPSWMLSLLPCLIIFSSNTCWSAFAVDWLLRSDTSHHQRLLYCLHRVWALPQNARISLPDHICQRSPVNALLRLKASWSWRQHGCVKACEATLTLISFCSLCRYPTYITFPFTLDSPFLPHFNQVLREMMQSGTLNKIWDGYQPVLTMECEEKRVWIFGPKYFVFFIFLPLGFIWVWSVNVSSFYSIDWCFGGNCFSFDGTAF